jgi:hypothetical protein
MRDSTRATTGTATAERRRSWGRHRSPPTAPDSVTRQPNPASQQREKHGSPGRNEGWLESKCVKRQEFVIGGFTHPGGTRSGIGALLVGHWDGGSLRFAGKVGTVRGFTAEYLTRVRLGLAELEQQHCPFDPPPPGWIGRSGHWVRPMRTGVVTFTEWTDAGTLRHASFQGFTVPAAVTALAHARTVAQPEPPAPAPARRRARERPHGPVEGLYSPRRRFRRRHRHLDARAPRLP